MIDLEEIFQTYTNLIEQYKKNDNKNMVINFNDIITITTLINHLSKSKKLNYLFYDKDVKKDNSFYLRTMKNIKDFYINNKDYFDGLYDSTQYVFNKHNISKKIIYLKDDIIKEPIDIKDIVLDYYSVQGEKQYKIAKELFDNKKIIYVNSKKNSTGAAFPIFSIHDNYIIAYRNKDNIKTASTIVHEIGHIIDAYSLGNLTNENYHSKNNSIYSELISSTHEYNFNYFLEQNGFNNTSKSLILRFFNDYIHYCTYTYLIGKYNMINNNLTISQDKRKIQQLTKYTDNNNLDDYESENNNFAYLPLNYTLCSSLGLELVNTYKDCPKDLNNVLEKMVAHNDNLSLDYMINLAGLNKDRLMSNEQFDKDYGKILTKEKRKKTI